MIIDNETWLINEGDKVIKKASSEGFDYLSSIEKAIYYFWVVDYAVRNSGTLQPTYDLNENSIFELIKFSKENGCDHLYLMMGLASDENLFCEKFYESFENACEDLRYFDKNRK